MISPVRLLIALLFLLAAPTNAVAAPEGFVLQGQIVDPSGMAVESASVSFNVQILSPANGCVLYEESFPSVNMTGTNGIYKINVGTGTRSGADYEDTSTISGILDNSQGNISGLNCDSGTDYNPNPGDVRKLRLTFDAGSGPITVAQDFNIQSVPYAQYANSLQGLEPTEIIQVNTATADVTQANLESIFAAPADTTELRSLIDGASTQYISSTPGSAVNFNGQILENIAAPDSDDDAVNRGWVNDNIAGNDASGIGTLGVGEQNQFLQWDGSAWVMADIASSALVDGGNATGSAVNVGTNDANDLVLETDNTPRLTIGSAGGVLIDSLGVTGSARVGGQLQLQDGDTNYISLQAPALAADVTFTLPNADGTSNQVLATDGSGNLIWKDDDDSVETDPRMLTLTAGEVNQLENIDTNTITNAQWGYLSGMTAQPLESESDPGLQTLSAAEVDQLENIDANAISNAQWGYLSGMSAQPLESESDPRMLTLSAGEVNQIENIDTNTITNAQWGYLANMGGQPLESFTETDPGLQTLSVSEIDQLENIDTNTITNAQWGYLANMSGQPLESFTEADTLANVTGRGANTSDDIQLDSQAQLRLGDDDNSNYVSLSAPAGMSADANFVLPSADGTSSQVLATDGSGNFYWKTDAGAAGGLNIGDTILAADGAVGAPGLAFNNDNDTGLYSSAANNLAFSTGGTQRMVILNDNTIDMLGNSITATQFGYLSSMSAQPLESESDPGLQTLSAAEVDQLENIDTNTITNAQWGYLANMSGQPLESFTETDPRMLTLSAGEVNQLENIDTNTITNAQWGYLANMSGQPLESFTESDPGLQTLSAAEVDQLENIDTNTITNAQWGYLANMSGQPLESFSEADTLDNVTGRGSNTANDIQLDSQAELRLGDDDNSNYVGLRAPAGMSANQLFTLPAADGTAAQVLATDGSGNFYWKNDAGASAGLSVGDTIPAADGTVGAPGITFDTDSDNGLFLSGTNEVGFVSGGTERMILLNDGTIDMLGNNITAAEFGYLAAMTGQPLESESDPGLQTLTAAEVDQLENIDTNTITNAQWGYLANMSGQPLESFTETDPGLQTLSAAEVDQLENIDTNTITNTQWGYLANMSGQPLESESDPGLQTLSAAEIDQLENIDTNTITNAQWGYLANMSGQPLESFTEADTLANVTGRGSNTSDDIQLDSQAQLRLGDDDNSNYVSLSAPSGMSANANFVLPSADGTSAQVLATDGSGNFYWKNDAGAGSGLSVGDTIPAANGSVGAPGITFDTDSDNGLFLSGTNEVGFVSGGTERMILLNDNTIDMLGNNITAAEFGYLAAMTGQPLESESDPGLQTLTAAEVDQLENIDTNTITNTQWGYLANMSGQPLESESDPGLQTLSAAEVDQLENIDTNTITNTQWGYLANMSGQPLESFIESDPGLQTLSTAEVDQLENIDTNTITNAQWGYLANMSGQPLESFSEADTLDNVTGRGANTANDIQLDSQAELRLGDDDNSNYVGLRAPAGMSADQLFTLPAADGTLNQVLATDGSGNFFWKNDAGAGSGLSVGDVIRAGDGLVGAPGLTFDNDPDTGLYSSAANNLAFTTGGTQRMVIPNDGTINILGNSITATQLGYLSSMSAQPLESYTETDPGLQTLSAAEVDQLENIDTNTITNAQWGYLANMGGQPLESFTESDPGLQTLSVSEIDQLENIDTNTITNTQWGYLANMSGQPLESESDPGLQTLSAAEVDQLENIDTNTITNAQWGYLANMSGQPLESFSEADTFANVTGRGSNTSDDIQLDSQAQLRLGDDDNSNYVSLSAPSGMSANANFVLPSADGTSAQVLATDGSGNFYWKNDAGAGAGLSVGDTIPAANGSVGAPGITFDTDSDNGLFLSGTNEVGFVSGGTERMILLNDNTIDMLGNNITAAEFGYLAAMTAQPLESESDPGLQTLTTAEVDQLENIGSNAITNAQWGYLSSMTGQPLESFTETDPGLQTLTTAEVDQLENIGSNAITNAQWGYLSSMTGQPLESFTETDPGLQTLTTAEVDQLENIGSNAITNAQWGYLSSMTGQPLESFTEADTLANVTGRGANTANDIQLDSQAELRFGDDDNSNVVALRAPAGMSADQLFTLPAADGTSAQVLATDGSGNFYWKNDAGAGSGLSSGDTLDAANGAVGSPGLTFSADSDTGLYRSAANEISFSTGGTQRMMINANGYVGIGDPTPTRTLDVDGDISLSPGTGQMDVSGDDIDFGDNGNDGSYNMMLGTAGVDDYNLGTVSGHKIRMTDSQGTDRHAVVVAKGDAASDTIFGVAVSTDSGSTWNPNFTVAQNGNVGIGTNSSAASLDVNGITRVRSDLQLANDANTQAVALKAPDALGTGYTLTLPNDDGTSGQILQTDGSGALSWATPASGADDLGDHVMDQRLQTNGNWINGDNTANEGLFIDNSGNVGVGTNSPSEEFELQKNQNSATVLAVNNPNSGGSSEADIELWANGSVGQIRKYSAAAGAGNLQIQNQELISLNSYGASGQIQMWTNGSEQATLSQTGDLNLLTENEVRFQDNTGGQYVGLKSPAAVGTSYTMELPDAAGTNGQILTADASGNLIWSTPASGADDLGDHVMDQNLETNGSWISNDGGNEGLFILANGNVGVGTNNPSNTLHVEGELYVAGTNDAIWTRSDGHVSLFGGDAYYYVGMPAYTGFGGGGSNAGSLEFKTGTASNTGVDDGSNEGWQLYYWGNQAPNPAANRSDMKLSFWNGGTEVPVMYYDSTGDVGVGTDGPAEKLTVSGNMNATGQIYSGQNVIASGATVDFDDGNIQVLESVGGTAITLNNMEDGGTYTLVVTDTTSREYTFTNCTNTHFSPTSAATTVGTETTYTILKVTISSQTHCYISWITGFSP